MKLFHHCSYLALGPERGIDETKAVPDVKWLFESQGRRGGIIVSPSWPIPTKGSKEDEGVQPPHRQAANHHRRRRPSDRRHLCRNDGAAHQGQPQALRI